MTLERKRRIRISKGIKVVEPSVVSADVDVGVVIVESVGDVTVELDVDSEVFESVTVVMAADVVVEVSPGPEVVSADVDVGAVIVESVEDVVAESLTAGLYQSPITV